jgi:hypothetical protein
MALLDCLDCGKQFSDQATACPNCGRPNELIAATPQPEAKQETQKNNGCLIGCASFLTIVAVLSLIGSLIPKTSDPTPTSADSSKSLADTDISWIPSGFTQQDNDTAIRWRKGSEINCDYRDSCYQMELVAKNGCRTLYVELTRLDSAGNNVGYTNDTTSNLQPNQKAILTFSAFEEDKSAQISKVNCY